MTAPVTEATPPPAADPGSTPGPGPGPGEVAAPPGGPPPRQAVTAADVARQAVGTMLVLLAVCTLGFAAWLAFGSKLYFTRVQVEAYESLSVPLANGTAPVGPTDPYNPNKLVALGSPVALLQIPALHLQDVVLEGTTGQVLEGGPGHVRDTPLPGQQGVSVILGRRAAYGAPFAGLGSLAPGDPISVITQEGVARYQVIDLRRAGSPLPPALEAGSGRLVLVTADGSPFFPTGELYVDASLVGKPFATPAQILTSATLPPAENAMGTEQQAWVPLVLWGQALLVAVGVLSWLSGAWGRWQTWLVAVPVLGYLSVMVADEVTRLLPNIM